MLGQRISKGDETATRLTEQAAYGAENDIPDFSSARLDTTNPVVVRRALMEYLPTDVSLNNMLQSDVGNWSLIYDAAIVGSDGKALLHTNANLVGKTVVTRPVFQRVLAAHFREQLRLVYSPAAVYNVSFPLQLNGSPFGTIRIGVSTVFLKSELTPRLMHALYFSIASVFASLVLAAGISNLALGPLREISRNLDSVSAGHGDELSGEDSGPDEFALLTFNIPHFAPQRRSPNQLFSTPKS